MNQALNSQRGRLLELADELTRTNDELKRVSEAKSDFVSAVSHDLRTPLTTIIEGVALVEDGTLGETNPKQKKFLRYALEDAERLRDLINDILDLTKIEAGKIVVNRTRVSIQGEIERTRRSFENYMQERGLQLVIEVPDDIPPVLADAGHYGRIVMNFLSNAAKFTPSGGRITVRVARETAAGPQRGPARETVVTSVIDTGVGIPDNQKHIIFGKFEQVKRTGSHQQPGSGLGLSLCKQLVELNSGSIGFESAENKGSRFFFALPAYSVVDDLSQALATAEQHAGSVSGLPVVFLLKFADGSAQPESVLAKVAEAVKPQILTYDTLRVVPEQRAVLLVSALPRDAAKPTFAHLVETLQKSGISGLAAAFHVYADAVPAGAVLAGLERRMTPIT